MKIEASQKAPKTAVDGVLLIDKSPGPTSHFVVSQIKRILRPERIGHLGTLDPFASGLLPILLGGATKLSDEAMDNKKGYLFRIQLGQETDTLDLSGRVVETSDHKVLSAELVEEALEEFRGTIRQVPPAYSALKKDGRPLYEYMRAEGKLPFDLEEKARNVNIYGLRLMGFDPAAQTIDLEAICSKGTYVRCLARDIARALGSVGHCTHLRRHIIEPWQVSGAHVFLGSELENTSAAETLLPHIQSPSSMVPQLPLLICEDEFVHTRVTSGNPVMVPSLEMIKSQKSDSPLGPITERSGLLKEGRCLFQTRFGLQYLAEYTIVENTLMLRPQKKTQSAAPPP